MPRFGIQAATFVQGWNRPAALRAIAAAAHLGFDALEIPLLRPNVIDVAAVRAAAHAAGVGLTCRTALPPGCSVLLHAERARVFLGRAVREAEALGAAMLGGALLYTPGELGPSVTPGDGALLVEVLADLASEAAARGVALALEPAHRFESRIVNSVTQAMAIVNAVGADNLGLSLSTLQLHISEPNLLDALRQAAPHLRSVRVVENTGGLPGTGAVRWEELWNGLNHLQFEGLLILEAPWAQPDGERSAEMDAAQMSRIAPTMDLYPEEYAAQGLAFLQAGVAYAGVAQAAVTAPAKPAAARRSAPRRTKRAPSSPAPTAESPASKSATAQPSAEKSSTAKPAAAKSAPAKPGAKSYRSR